MTGAFCSLLVLVVNITSQSHAVFMLYIIFVDSWILLLDAMLVEIISDQMTNDK